MSLRMLKYTGLGMTSVVTPNDQVAKVIAREDFLAAQVRRLLNTILFD